MAYRILLEGHDADVTLGDDPAAWQNGAQASATCETWDEVISFLREHSCREVYVGRGVYEPMARDGGMLPRHVYLG